MSDTDDVCALVGATIIDGNGGSPIRDGVILVEGTQIVAVGDSSIEVPERAKRIAVSGKFVIPGLMSAYSYLTDAVSTMTFVRYEGRYDEVVIEAAQLTLKGGLTTICDGWGPRDASIKAREAIKRGQEVASRIYIPGNLVGCDGPFSRDLVPEYRVAFPEPFAARIESQFRLNVGHELTRMTPQQVRGEIRKYVHSGIDFLSYALTDHRVSQYIPFSPRVQEAIVEEAHRAGLVVSGGTPATGEAFTLGLNAGIDISMVGSEVPLSLTEDTLALVAKRRLPLIFRFETAETMEWFRERARAHPTESSRGLLRWFEAGQITGRQLFDAGAVPLLAAPGKVSNKDERIVHNDIFPPLKGYNDLGDSHIYQLRGMRDFGMTPMAVLQAATRDVARAYKIDGDLGTLECGKIADLLVLDGNPLEDVEHYSNIRLVMKEGKIVDREALPTRRLVTAPPEV